MRAHPFVLILDTHDSFEQRTQLCAVHGVDETVAVTIIVCVKACLCDTPYNPIQVVYISSLCIQ